MQAFVALSGPKRFPQNTSVFQAAKEAGRKEKMVSPHLVDFAKNMQYSTDGKAYLGGQGSVDPDPKPREADLSWITSDQIYKISKGVRKLENG